MTYHVFGGMLNLTQSNPLEKLAGNAALQLEYANHGENCGDGKGYENIDQCRPPYGHKRLRKNCCLLPTWLSGSRDENVNEIIVH